MILTNREARQLGEKILRNLRAWDAIVAVAQCGGLEDKARGRISDAMTEWLQADVLPRRRANLLVLPEYRIPGDRSQIDFVLFDRRFIGTPRLRIKTLFEVKSNFSTQFPMPEENCTLELPRVTAAIGQTSSYIEWTQARAGYLIYLVTDRTFTARELNTSRRDLQQGGQYAGRDNGWRHFRKPKAEEELRDFDDDPEVRDLRNAMTQIIQEARKHVPWQRIVYSSYDEARADPTLRLGCIIVRV